MVKTGNCRYICETCCAIIAIVFFLVPSSLTSENTVLSLGSAFGISCDNRSNELEFASMNKTKFTIYKTNKLDKYYIPRANVSNNSQLQILISDIQAEDAGAYGCVHYQTGSSQKFIFHLIVLNSQPKCHYELQVNGTNSTVTISCSVSYSGFWDPIMECTDTNYSIIKGVQTKQTESETNITLIYISTVHRRVEQEESVEQDKYYCRTLFTVENKPNRTQHANNIQHLNNIPEYNHTYVLEITWPIITRDPRDETTHQLKSSISIVNRDSRIQSSRSLNTTTSQSTTTTTSSVMITGDKWVIMGTVIGVITLLVSVAFGVAVLFFLLQQRKKPRMTSHVCTRTAEKSTSLSRSVDISILRTRRQRISSFLSQLTRSSTNYDESEYAEIVSRRCTLASKSVIGTEPNSISLSQRTVEPVNLSSNRNSNADIMKSNSTILTNKAVYSQVNKTKCRNENRKSDIMNITNTPDVVGSQIPHSKPQMSELEEAMYSLKPPKEIYDTCPLDNIQRYDTLDIDGYASTTDV